MTGMPDIQARVIGFGVPCCMGLADAKAANPWMTSYIIRNDFVSNLSYGSVIDLLHRAKFIMTQYPDRATRISMKLSGSTSPSFPVPPASLTLMPSLEEFTKVSALDLLAMNSHEKHYPPG